MSSVRKSTKDVMSIDPLTGQLDTYRGGNLTRGANRRGYRGGRKSAFPPGTLTVPLRILVTDANYAAIHYLGERVFARGVARAVEAVLPFLKGPIGMAAGKKTQKRDVERALNRIKSAATIMNQWDDLETGDDNDD